MLIYTSVWSLLCGSLVLTIPYSFVFYLLDFFVGNFISLITGQGIAFKPFRIGKFATKRSDE